MSLTFGSLLALCLYLALAILPGLALLDLAGVASGRSFRPRKSDSPTDAKLGPTDAPHPPSMAALRPSVESAALRFPDLGPDPWFRLGLAAGLGLALQPLVYLLARSLGLGIGSTTWWILLELSAGWLLWPVALALQDWLRTDRRGLDRPHGVEDQILRAGPIPTGPIPTGPIAVEHSRPRSKLFDPAGLALFGLLGILLASRWWAVRDLSIPMFGDSLHHTMIVRLFALQGGLPNDWRPFAELGSFSYHFGLHAAAASLSMLSGLPAPRALILSGQGLMLLQALTVYALVAGLTGRRWAGVGAALAAGGLGTMPAYYANWGRYTQLAGQVLLPVALLLTVRAAGGAEESAVDPEATDRKSGGDDPDSVLPQSSVDPVRIPASGSGRGQPTPLLDSLPSGWRAGLLAALSVAGLALTHYIVTLLYALAVVAWLALGIRGGWRTRLRPLARLAGVAAAALLLASPWIPRVLAGPLDESAIKMSTGKLPDPEVYGLVSPWQVWNPDALGRNLGWWLLAAFFALGLFGILRRERLTQVGLAWIGLIFLATYPRLLGLPITGVLKDFTVAVGAYLPAALVVGGGMGALAAALGLQASDGQESERPSDGRGEEVEGRSILHQKSGARHRRLAASLAASVLLIAGLRAWQDRALIDPAFQLVFPADEAAMAWIREHTPPDARFLVSSFSAFGDTVQAGDDAGWWLPLLAEPRGGTLPPITYGIEQGFEPDYRLQVNSLAAQWQSGIDSPETLTALAAAGVSHAYVGQSAKALDRTALLASPHWRQLYAEGGAEVYALRRSESESTLSGESGFAESGPSESSTDSSRIRDSGSVESEASSPSITTVETLP